jgi:hypothetical protein
MIPSDGSAPGLRIVPTYSAGLITAAQIVPMARAA